MLSTTNPTAAATAAPAAAPSTKSAPADDLANVPEYTTIPILDVHVALDAPASAYTESGPRGDALRALALQMRAACTQSGFFLITNHGVPDAQIADMVAQCRRVFALSKQEKDALRSGHNRGYFAIGEENLNPEVQVNGGDFKEGMDIGADLADQRPGEMFRGTTPYPTDAQVPGFRAACGAYFDAMSKLGRAVMRVLAVAMGQPADFFDQVLTRPMTQLRLLRYPAAPAGMTESRLSCAAHTDYGGITLLAVDSPGLQVLVPNSHSASAADLVAHPTSRAHAPIHGGTWMRVPTVPGTLVVNIADMIARYTNRTFHSTLHRVVHAGVNQDRYSIPFFFDMDADTVVRVLPEFMPGGKLANPEIKEVFFPDPIVFEEHLKGMYDSTYGAGKREVAAS